jgi:hypothetical protein
MIRLPGCSGGGEDTVSKSREARRAIDKSELFRFLAYDSISGVFKWKERPSNCVRIGDVAGNRHRGYIRIRVLGHLFPAHELAWFFSYGEWPRFEIDHINGDGTHNGILNLRDVLHAVNGQNQRRARTDNKLGKLGVISYRGGYVAKIMLHGRTYYLGKHKTPEAAHQAYLLAKRELHEGCTI